MWLHKCAPPLINETRLSEFTEHIPFLCWDEVSTHQLLIKTWPSFPQCTGCGSAVANAMPDFHHSMKDSLRTPEQGADTVVWLAVSEAAAAKPSGRFYQGKWQNSFLHTYWYAIFVFVVSFVRLFRLFLFVWYYGKPCVPRLSFSSYQRSLGCLLLWTASQNLNSVHVSARPGSNNRYKKGNICCTNTKGEHLQAVTVSQNSYPDTHPKTNWVCSWLGHTP